MMGMHGGHVSVGEALLSRIQDAIIGGFVATGGICKNIAGEGALLQGIQVRDLDADGVPGNAAVIGELQVVRIIGGRAPLHVFKFQDEGGCQCGSELGRGGGRGRDDGQRLPVPVHGDILSPQPAGHGRVGRQLDDPVVVGSAAAHHLGLLPGGQDLQALKDGARPFTAVGLHRDGHTHGLGGERKGRGGGVGECDSEHRRVGEHGSQRLRHALSHLGLGIEGLVESLVDQYLDILGRLDRHCGESGSDYQGAGGHVKQKQKGEGCKHLPGGHAGSIHFIDPVV